jgi:ankyrin repeat protein
MSQPPSLETVREFVIAGHFNLPKVQQMLAEQPALLNLAHEWKPGDRETALQGAAHVGQRGIAEYLLGQGSPLEICTAAMLGRGEAVERFLTDDPELIHATGAHGISLLAHAALSGQVALVALLAGRGASAGREAASQALNNAVRGGHTDLARWLLEHAQPDLAWTDFQGKTSLETAQQQGQAEMVALLEKHSAMGNSATRP